MIIRDAGPYYCIYGSDDEETVAILEENLDSGLVFKGETLEELAKSAASIPKPCDHHRALL